MLVLQFLDGGAGVALRLSRTFALRTYAKGLLQLRQLALFLVLMRLLRLRVHQFQQRGHRLEALGAVEDLLCQVDGHRAAFLHRRIVDQAPRSADVAEGGEGGQVGVVIRGALADQLGGNALHRRGGNVEVAATRAKGLGEVLGGVGRRAHDDHGARRRLLYRLEQGIRAVIVEAVGVVEDHHAPRGHRGQARSTADDLAHRIHGDDDLLRIHEDQIGVLFGLQHRAASLAAAAAWFLRIRAHERGRKIDRGQGTAGARRASK